MSLPHRFPFRLIEAVRDGRARCALTLSSYWLRETGVLPVGLLAEAMAQASALLLREPGAPARDLLLAGLEGIECDRPLRAGDRLEFEAVIEAKLGAAVRVAARVYVDGVETARGRLLLTAA